jgi:hypothetical protein
MIVSSGTSANATPTQYEITNICNGSGTAGPYSYSASGGTCNNGFRGTSPSGSGGIFYSFSSSVDVLVSLVGFNHLGECLQVSQPFVPYLGIVSGPGLQISGNGSPNGTVCAVQDGLTNGTTQTIEMDSITSFELVPVGGNPAAQRSGFQSMSIGDPTSGSGGGTPPPSPPTINVNGGPSDGAQYNAGSTPPALNYSCDNATSCTATDESGDSIGSGGQPPTGPGTHTITYAASGPGGNVTKTVTYTVPFPPTITINAAPSEGAVYEFKTTFPPPLSWSCANATSCTATDEHGNSLAQGAVEDGSRGNHTITFAASGPGGSTSKTVHYTVVDTIHPDVVITTPIDGKLYVQNRDNVPATFSCSDLELDTCTAVDQNGNSIAEGEQLADVYGRNFKLIVTGLDLAGNSTTKSVTYSVDAPPTAAIAVPLVNDVLFQGETLPADYSCADIDGTVTSCTGNVPVGSAIDSSTIGSHTFSVTATDNDGVSTTVSTNYKVVPVVGSCRGVAISLLGITLADANPKYTPCASDAHQVIGGTVVITPAIPLLGVAANSISIGAITGTSAFTPKVQPGETAAGAQIANVTINLLGTSINLTGITSTATAQLTRCSAPTVLSSIGYITSLTINGKAIAPPANSAHNVVVPLGIGSLILNQQVVSGSSVTEDVVHLNVLGLVDLVIGGSSAEVHCGS